MTRVASKTNLTTQKVLNHLLKNGAYAWRANSTGIWDPTLRKYRASAKKGVSDILGCLPPNGRLLAIEIKTGKDRLSMEQIGFLKSIEYHGGLSFVAKDFDSFKEWWYTVVYDTRKKSS